MVNVAAMAALRPLCDNPIHDPAFPEMGGARGFVELVGEEWPAVQNVTVETYV
jgi:hypothetical protein